MNNRLTALSGMVLLLLIPFALLCTVPSGEDPLAARTQQILQQMSLDQKIGQMLMIGLTGKYITPHDLRNIINYKPGGFIIMSYNNRETALLKKFTAGLKAACLRYGGIPPLLASDKEGGFFTSIIRGLTIFPPNYAFGAVNETNLTFAAAAVTGYELRQLGLNMNLAPVLDVHSNPKNPIINTRSFSSNASVAARHAASYIAGMRLAGCITTGKHFPGHGATLHDSHRVLPTVSAAKTTLMQRDIVPFAAAAQADIPIIMTSHIHYPALDPVKESASLSHRILTGILRNTLGFRGVIMTDDLNMDSIDYRMQVETAALKSVKAGADLLLTIACHGRLHRIFHTLRRAVVQGEIPVSRINASVRRILRLKLEYRLLPSAGSNTAPAVRLQEILSNRTALNNEVARKALHLQLPAACRSNTNYRSYWLRDWSRIHYRLGATPVPRIAVNWIPAIMQATARRAEPLQIRLFFSKQLTGWEYNLLSYYRRRYPRLRIIRVVIGNPFDIVKYPFSDGRLYTFSRTFASLDAAADAVSGRLKLEQSNYFPKGFFLEGSTDEKSITNFATNETPQSAASDS